MQRLVVVLALFAACSGPTRGRAPDIVVEPGTALLFGRVVVGTTASAPVVVRNAGDAPLVITAATIGGPFGVDPAPLLASPLGPGEARAVVVTYSPTVGAATEDRLRIDSNDPDQPARLLPVRAPNAGPHLRVEPPLVDFGLVEGQAGPVAARVVNDGTEAVTLAAVTLVGGAEFTVIDAGPPAGAVLAPGDEFELQVAWALVPGASGSGRVDVRAMEMGIPDARLELRSPPVAVVGADLDVEPLVGVMLDGSDSRAPGNLVTGYRWTVVESPIGSRTVVDFANGDPQIVRDEEKCPGGQNDVATPCFFPDVPGVYRFALVVTDARPICPLRSAGETCADDAECCSFNCGGTCQAGGGVCATPPAQGCELASANGAIQTVRAIPAEDALFVTLSWDGDGDLDLHMVRDSGPARAWVSADDVYWSNPNPDWGVPDTTNGVSCMSSVECTMSPFSTCRAGTCTDTTDDPRLLIDVTSGFGPEAIGVKIPPADTYHIGVHYFPDEHMALRRATVRVFVNGTERFPPGFGPMSPMSVILRRNDFWYVGRVVVPAVIDDATVEAEPLGPQNPRANADPGNYPPLP